MYVSDSMDKFNFQKLHVCKLFPNYLQKCKCINNIIYI